MTTDQSTDSASTSHRTQRELAFAVKGFVLVATRGERGQLVPCELRDANGRTLGVAAAIVAFGGASYGQALDRALREADTSLDEPINFALTEAALLEHERADRE
jgi:hypothetical protein